MGREVAIAAVVDREADVDEAVGTDTARNTVEVGVIVVAAGAEGIVGVIAYWNRVTGYALLLVTDEYPTFSL